MLLLVCTRLFTHSFRLPVPLSDINVKVPVWGVASVAWSGFLGHCAISSNENLLKNKTILRCLFPRHLLCGFSVGADCLLDLRENDLHNIVTEFKPYFKILWENCVKIIKNKSF